VELDAVLAANEKRAREAPRGDEVAAVNYNAKARDE